MESVRETTTRRKLVGKGKIRKMNTKKLFQRRLGLPYEDWGDKYRSFPVKKHEDQTANLDHQGGSDTSQAKKNEYSQLEISNLKKYLFSESRFVLNRKLNARPNSASTPSSHLVPSTSAQNDEIFIDGVLPF